MIPYWGEKNQKSFFLAQLQFAAASTHLTAASYLNSLAM